MPHLQLNNAIMKRCTYPWPYWVKGKALHAGRFALELGEHGCFMRAAAAMRDADAILDLGSQDLLTSA